MAICFTLSSPEMVAADHVMTNLRTLIGGYEHLLRGLGASSHGWSSLYSNSRNHDIEGFF
jgi:hypothetical protein